MKAVMWIIGVVALVLIAVGVFVVMNSGALLERAMEGYGTRYLGAPVEVEGVDVSLGEGAVTIAGLTIANPEGFDGPPAFQLERITADLATDQISSELVVLEEVTVDGARVAALVQGTRMNLKQIMDHLNARIAANQQAEETGVASEVKLIIDRFSFTNGRASVESDLAGQAAIDIPPIEVTDIGRQSNGATVGQVLKQILEPIYRAVTRAMVNQGIDVEGAKERLEQNVREKVGDRIGGGLKSLTDRLSGEDKSNE